MQSTSHPTSTFQAPRPAACGDPDPCGLAPAAAAALDATAHLPTLDPLAPVGPAPRRPASTRLRGGLVRRGAVMRHLAADAGQGTVEYVGLLLLMATLLAAIVGGVTQMGGKEKIGQKVVNQISDSIDKVEAKSK